MKHLPQVQLNAKLHSMKFPGLDDYVTMDAASHTYWDKDGRQYESVSKFISRFYEAFDAQLISRGDVELQEKWAANGKAAADRGTRIHESLEHFEKTATMKEGHDELKPMVMSVIKEYKGYYRVFQEQLLYDTDSLIAGTSDKLCMFSNHPKSVIDISDYKNYEKGLPQINISNKGERVHKYMLGPLSHLIDSKFNRVCLQLSVYAYMLEKKTGRRIGKLFIHVIPPDNMLAHYMVPMMYMKYEVEAMMLHKKITDN